MSYYHLTISERSKIEVLKGLGYSCRAIARHLNRSHTTISRELKRLNEWSAEKAQWHAVQKDVSRHSPSEKHVSMSAFKYRIARRNR